MNHKETSQAIIEAVGGKENVNNAWHCMTRLRFNLKKVEAVDYEALEKIPHVVGTKYQSDQLQVVIGTDVADYFRPLAKELGLEETRIVDSGEKKGLVSLFMDTVSGVFGPLVPAIAGAGMIKGLMAGLVALNVLSNQTDSYLVIDMIASGVFTFLPFFVAASAAKIFQTNQYLAIAIAAASGVEGLFAISPILAGIVVGAIRPIAIFTGLHHAMTPIALQNFANQGYDMLMPMMFMANMAITGATAAIYTKVTTKEEKTLVLSSAISGILGITEPALFGILSKYKKAFAAATIGSALASAFISFFGVRIYGYILSSIFSLPAYIGQYFIFAVLGILIALVSSFLVTYLLVPKEETEDFVTNEVDLHAVAQGAYVPLEDVPDEVFSTKMMGDGFAIEPINGEIYAPVSGVVTTIFPSKHAIGIKTTNGVEILVHMGIDTVSLNGEGFELFVQAGDKVSSKTKIAKMDLDYIRTQKKSTIVMVIILNMERVVTLHGEKRLDGTHQSGELLEKVVLN